MLVSFMFLTSFYLQDAFYCNFFKNIFVIFIIFLISDFLKSAISVNVLQKATQSCQYGLLSCLERLIALFCYNPHILAPEKIKIKKKKFSHFL